LKNVLLIGFLTAIAEEFMFRGVANHYATVDEKHPCCHLDNRRLFSAFHMEFYGFLPRLLLGALFGYFVAWSGSIWPAVWGHFLNNGTAVVSNIFISKKNKAKP
jgi:membrane protease YdiL (CAAX protease family)